MPILKAERQVRVGPAGWSYPDWEGVVYPRPKPRGFHPAEYLAHFFDTIEINTSFYQPLRAENAKTWVSRVEHNPSFRFTAKLWRGFTHERTAGREDEKRFKTGIAPIALAGRLGALLLQFPWSFRNTRENREHLGALVVQFMEYPLVVEVRHGSWNQPGIYQMLSDLDVGFCNIDQPVIGQSIRPSSVATAPVGYVRLHGRNYEKWFNSENEPEQRYNYLYRLNELQPWVERIRTLMERVKAAFVITNNDYGGKGIVNALQLIHLLSGRPVRAPESLAPHFPELKEITAIEPPGASSGESGQLFPD